MAKCGCLTYEMLDKELYERLNVLRDEYRQKMNGAAERAQRAAAIDA